MDEIVEGTCMNCGYVTKTENYGSKEYPRYLCSICASTRLSMATVQSVKNLEPGEYYILLSLGTLFNALIDALDIRDKFEERLSERG